MSFYGFSLFLSTFERYAIEVLFKQRKNKSFSYTPRFSKEEKDNSNQEEISKYRDFSSKWRQNQGLGNRKLKKGMSLPILILVLILILICMYVLDIKFMA